MIRIILGCLLLALGFLAFATPAQATCLEPEFNRTLTSAFWVNKCDQKVYVNWNNDRSCRDWSCAASVGPNKRISATINPYARLQWCEFYNGTSGKGPCAGGSSLQAAEAAPNTTAAPNAGPSPTRCAALRDYLAGLRVALADAAVQQRQAQDIVDIYNSNGKRDSTGYAHYSMGVVAKLSYLIREGEGEIVRLNQEISGCR